MKRSLLIGICLLVTGFLFGHFVPKTKTILEIKSKTKLKCIFNNINVFGEIHLPDNVEEAQFWNCDFFSDWDYICTNANLKLRNRGSIEFLVSTNK